MIRNSGQKSSLKFLQYDNLLIDVTKKDNIDGREEPFSSEEIYKDLLDDTISTEQIIEKYGLEITIGITNDPNKQGLYETIPEHTDILENPTTDILKFNNGMPSPSEYAGGAPDINDLHELSNELHTKEMNAFIAESPISLAQQQTYYSLDKTPETAYFVDFKEGKLGENITREDLILQFGNAIGIIPSLQTKEYSINVAKKLSNEARDLFFMPGVLTTGYTSWNGLPTKEEIEYYDSLSPLTKAKIRPEELSELPFHPLKTLYLVANKFNGIPGKYSLKYEAQKEDTPVFNKNQNNELGTANYNIKDGKIVTKNSLIYPPADTKGSPYTISIGTTLGSNAINEAIPLFSNKYHFVPRILPELVSSALSEPKTARLTAKEIANKVFSEFDRATIDKIAKYHNAALYVLSNYIDIKSLKENLLHTFASEADIADFEKLEDSGFFKWFEKHKKEVSPADLATFLEKAPKLRDWTIEGRNAAYGQSHNGSATIDEKTTVSQLLNLCDNIQAFQDIEEIRSMYHGWNFNENKVLIKGRDITAKFDKYTARILGPADLKNITVGYDTHCCQHIGSCGGECTINAVTSPFSAIFVIEDNKGKVVAQSYIWQDNQKDALVFDNIEYANDQDFSKYAPLIYDFIAALPHKNVHVGTQYNTQMSGIGTLIKSSEKATMPKNKFQHHVYTDYTHTARVLIRDGHLMFNPADRSVIQKINYDEEYHQSGDIFKPEYSFLLSTTEDITSEELEEYVKNVKEILETHKYTFNINNFSKFDQILCNFGGDILKEIETIPPEVQEHIAKYYHCAIPFIKNPTKEILSIQIIENPDRILDYLDKGKRFSDEFIEKFLNTNAYMMPELIARNVHIPTRFVVSHLIENPYNILDIPKEAITDDVISECIRQNPRLATLFPHMDHNIFKRNHIVEATKSNTDIISILKKDFTYDEQEQVEIVRNNPSAIIKFVDISNNSGATVSREAAEIALTQKPSLMKYWKLQKKFPDLIPSCIAACPKILRDIPYPSDEYIQIALDHGYRTKDTNMNAIIQDYLARKTSSQSQIQEDINITR